MSMIELAGTVAKHAVLVKIEGVGVLMTGESGSGKSEIALGLISKGHSLVADDIVEIERSAEGLIGSVPERFAGCLNIRNIGVLDVVELFGERAFASQCRIDLGVEIASSRQNSSNDEPPCEVEILGVRIPKYAFSTNGTRDLVLLIETVVKLLNYSKAIKTIDSI